MVRKAVSQAENGGSIPPGPTNNSKADEIIYKFWKEFFEKYEHYSGVSFHISKNTRFDGVRNIDLPYILVKRTFIYDTEYDTITIAPLSLIDAKYLFETFNIPRHWNLKDWS